jgi:hypothetical protein
MGADPGPMAKNAILSGPDPHHISRGDDPPYPPMRDDLRWARLAQSETSW